MELKYIKSLFLSFSQSFQFKKNLFSYSRNIQTLIPNASLPEQFHNCSEMLCFKFAQQLFSSTANALILQNTNYVKASKEEGKKSQLLSIYKVG